MRDRRPITAAPDVAKPPLAKALAAGGPEPTASVTPADERLQLTALLTTLPGMAYRCKNDRDWTMEFVSQGAESLTGYARPDLVENRRVAYGDLIHPDDRGSVWEQVQAAVHEKRPFQITYRLVTPAGDKVVWEQGIGVFSSEGDLVGLEGYITDISDRTRLEARVLENERLAAIGTAASVFAHEVGNPLNNMFLQGQILERKLKRLNLEEEIGPGLSSMMAEIRRLNHLLAEFRGLSRRQKIELRPLSLASLIDQTAELAQADGVTIRKNVEHELPQIVGSHDKLKQVLLNLCKNAVEAMNGAGTLTLGARRSGGDRVELFVTDTGPGVAADLDIFEPFRTTKEQGTGLGLPVAKQIVVAHSGSITFTSQPGEGTTFRVTLPIDPEGKSA